VPKQNETIQKQIRKVIRQNAKPLNELAKRIHANPELGFAEVKACRWQTQLLGKWGFAVKTPFAGCKTGYRAIYKKPGKVSPAFAFMAEYDALPEIGHGCGHNLICTAAIAAALAVGKVLKDNKRPGRVMVLGTPAEESGGGKVIMIDHGALRGVDAAMMVHPSRTTNASSGCTAIDRLEVRFHGKPAHAAGTPELGINALDAVMLLFEGVNAWRQQLPESSRIHGIVTEGGVKPNIIPEQASCFFYIRSPDDKYLAKMVRRFKNIVKGAALMTDTKAEYLERPEKPFKALRPSVPMNDAFLEAAKAAGLTIGSKPKPSRGSSDCGDVSHEVPAIHPYFSIFPKKTAAGHSREFTQASGTAFARAQTLKAAEAMAMVGYRYLTDPDYRKTVDKQFAAMKK